MVFSWLPPTHTHTHTPLWTHHIRYSLLLLKKIQGHTLGAVHSFPISDSPEKKKKKGGSLYQFSSSGNVSNMLRIFSFIPVRYSSNWRQSLFSNASWIDDPTVQRNILWMIPSAGESGRPLGAYHIPAPFHLLGRVRGWPRSGFSTLLIS